MSSEESSNSRDSEWAVVTKNGELESEEEISCSESSIELLSSDDESLADRSSVTGSQSGPFFVLRLRSKDISTESDSDEKEVPAKRKAQKKEATKVKFDQVSKEDDSQGIRSTREENATESNNASQSSQITRSPSCTEEDDKSQAEAKLFSENNIAVEEIASAREGIENVQPEEILTTSDYQNDVDAPASHISTPSMVSEVLNNISFPSNSSLSDESIPELLNFEDKVHDSIEQVVNTENPITEDNHSLLQSEEDGRIDEASENVHDDTTSSMTSSNFSFLGNDEMNEGGNENGDEPPVTNHGHENQGGEVVNRREHMEEIQVSIRNTRDASRLSRREPCWYFVVEASAILIVGSIAFLFGFIKGYNSDLKSCCVDNDYMRTQLDVKDQQIFTMKQQFKTNFIGNIDGLLQEIDSGIETELKQDKVDCPVHHGQAGILLLNTSAPRHLCLLRHRFIALKTGFINRTKELTDLKEKSNLMKNENADLHREIIEHGKRKYLINELEDENIALFNRISDIENQLMDAEDQAYILKLQLSKAEKKTAISVDETIMELKDMKASLEEEKTKLKNEIAKLVNENKSLRADNDRFKDETKTYMHQISDLKRQIERLEEEKILREIDEDETIDVVDEGNEKQEEKKNSYKQESNKKSNKEEKSKKEQQERSKKEKTFTGHQSWSDAVNDILNKTKISMGTVNEQIQQTLFQVKNLSEELWKKHEPAVNEMLSSAYHNVKKNVENVAKKVSHVADSVVKKSAKWIRKYRKSRKHRKHYDDNDDEETYRASSSRRVGRRSRKGRKEQKDQNVPGNQGNAEYSHQGGDNYPGYLKNELQSLHDSVEFTNIQTDLGCSIIVDIMEDFQQFKKAEGPAMLSKQEKSWFYCQKDWFESMAYSDPTIDTECKKELGSRQLAASDNQCCPCLGQYGRSNGKFCNIINGCSVLTQKTDQKTPKEDKQEKGKTKLDETQTKNKTEEEEVAKQHGKYIYCDPFSKDMDCGDESWYLKRMKERDHLRKYRTSIKTDWMFHRAEERDFYRTQPDNWYFRNSGGQAYEPHSDDLYGENEDVGDL